MALKDKKRKPDKTPASAVESAPVAEARAVAPAAAQSAAVVTKEPAKPKATKPAPVLTKKPSRLRFFVDAYLELKKAHWLSRREATRLSLLVAAVCLAVGVVLGVLDLGFSWLMRLLLFRS